jgi:hypothetical protein
MKPPPVRVGLTAPDRDNGVREGILGGTREGEPGIEDANGTKLAEAEFGV